MRWVRPLLSIIGFVAITIGFFQDRIESVAYFGLVTGMVVWWYKSRDSDKSKNPPT